MPSAVICGALIPAAAAAGKTFDIVPPATAVKLPALDMVPEFTMFSNALRCKFKFETRFLYPGTPPCGITVVINAPGLLNIFAAPIVAVVIAELFEMASSVPKLLRLPVKFNAALATLLMAVTPCGITNVPALLNCGPIFTVPPTALPAPAS